MKTFKNKVYGNGVLYVLRKLFLANPSQLVKIG